MPEAGTAQRQELPRGFVARASGAEWSFVCRPCGEGQHFQCRGGAWCDCQHVVPPARP